jgi:DNA-binding MarR family transcriptional regulator
MGTYGLGTRLRHLIDLLDGDLTEVYRTNDLAGYRPKYTPVFRALILLGPTPITAIAAHSKLTHSAVSQTVAEMRRRKLVTSVKGKDTRVRVIALAPAGERILPRLEAQWQATNEAASLLDRELTMPLSTIVDEAIAALQRQPFYERVKTRMRAAGGELLDASPAATVRTNLLGDEGRSE